MNGSHRIKQLFGRVGFEEIAGGASLRKRLDNVFFVVVLAEHQHLGGGRGLGDSVGRSDAAHSGHSDIQYDYVWMEFRRECDRFFAACSLADDFTFPAALEQEPQRLAQHPMVIGEYNLNLSVALGHLSSGISATSLVEPGLESIRNRPPISSSRSASPLRPIPLELFVIPLPLSRMESCTRLPRFSTPISTRLAPEWRITFESASRATW